MSPQINLLVGFATVMVMTATGIYITNKLKSDLPSQGGEENPTPGGDNNGKGPNPDFAALISAIKAEGDANRKEEKREDVWGKILDGLTLIVLACTLVALVMTYHAIDEQVREMKKAYGPIETQAAAAKIQADASEISADAATAGQRAWIAPLHFGFIALNNSVDPLETRIQYQNVGREPAKNVRIRTRIGWFVVNQTSPYEWINLAQWNKPENQARNICDSIGASDPSTVVYPSATVLAYTDTHRDPNFSDAYLAAVFLGIKEKTVMYVVQGCFSYETISRRRFSSFCEFLNPDSGGQSISEWQFSACPVGNDDYDEKK